MPQWFVRFPELSEFSEFLLYLGKIPLSYFIHVVYNMQVSVVCWNK